MYGIFFIFFAGENLINKFLTIKSCARHGFRVKKMKKLNLKTKHLLAVLAVATVPMLTLSSCALLSDSSSTDYKKTYENYGYHFTSETIGGQLLCYRYLNSNEVGCVTPEKYQDPVTGTPTEYKLSGNVVIPKTVSDGVNTYTVSALLATPVLVRLRSWKRPVALWGGLCDIENLVIPETVKIIEDCAVDFYPLQLGGENVKNIIIYGPTNKDCFDRNRRAFQSITISNEDKIRVNEYESVSLYKASGGLNGDLSKLYSNANFKPTNYWKHVPQGVFSKKELAEKGNTIEIVGNYDIYAEGNSLEEYLKLANDEIWQTWMMSQDGSTGDFAVMFDQETYEGRSDFAVMFDQGTHEDNGIIMYFKITDNDNHFVEFIGSKNARGTLVIPAYVTYHKTRYTVTAAEVDGLSFTVIPETCKNLEFHCTNHKYTKPEVICYSSDVNITSSAIHILHVPHGCVEKYKMNAQIACLEIVDNYSIYENGHSIEEYLSMSRDAVEKARSAKIKADEDAKLAQKKKEEAEKKAYRQELAKKYGAKYVNALYDKGQITIGMPIELFDIGLNEHLFTNPRISYVELDSKTAHGSCFRMYKISTNDFSSLFVGWVYFNNDRVSAVKY